MVWDATVPADSDFISLGDDVIRAFKTDVAAGLTAEGSFPGADTANPAYIHTPSYGNTASRPVTNLVTGRLYINTETKAVERYNGSGWDAVDVSQGSVLAGVLAGLGLVANGSALDVNVDGSTLEISSDTVRVKDSGITAAKIGNSAVTKDKVAAAALGNGLSGGAGNTISVNVDSSTTAIDGSNNVIVKDGGITNAKIASVDGTKLIINSVSGGNGTSVDNAYPLGFTLDLTGSGNVIAQTWTLTPNVVTLTVTDDTTSHNSNRAGMTFQRTSGALNLDSSTLYYIALPHQF